MCDVWLFYTTLLMFLNSSLLDPIMRGLQNRHPQQHVNGVAIVGFNALYDNYYHWVADTLIYGDNIGRTVHQQVCWEEIPFAEKIIAATGLQNAQPSPKLYIARTDTAGRAMSNEPEVIARLEAMGFEIFIGSQHSVAQQVKAFREARLIVAPHGAGLTNLLFCHPGTVVVEWQQSGYFNTGMMRLAQLNNLAYHSQMFFPAAADEFSRDWTLDIDRAFALIDQLERTTA